MDPTVAAGPKKAPAADTARASHSKMVPVSDSTSDFLAWRDRGDLRALARAFDAVAPELLLAAWHVAPCGADAEDLVQGTFLCALEAAERFDAERRLTPWLVGILTNLARKERGRRRRLDHERASPAAALPDPADEVAEREFAQSLAECLAAMPQPYRSTLTLRWVHGLTPAQIARSQGLSLGTVKTQLHRGLERLRQTLPAGVTASAFLTLGVPARAMADVREAVLHRARVLRPAAVEATVGSTLRSLSARVGPVGVVAACVLTGVLAIVATERSASVESVALAAAAVTQPRGAGPAFSPAAQRRPLGAQSAPGESASARALLVRFAGDGEPAREALVSVVPWTDSDPWLRETWQRTDAEGRLPLPAQPGRYRVEPLCADRPTMIDVGSAAAALPALDIVRGVRVRGRVVDERGAPVADAAVWMSRASSASDGVVLARSDADGAFVVDDVPNARALAAWTDDGPASSQEIVRGAPGTERSLLLQLGPRSRAVRGRLLDEVGRPVAGARLTDAPGARTAIGARRPPPARTVATDSDGCFAWPAASSTVLCARAPGFALTVVHLDADRRGVQEFALARGRMLRGRATSADGQAAAGARVDVRCVVASEGAAPLSPTWMHAQAVAGGDGCFRIEGLPEAEVCVRVLAPDGSVATLRLAPSTRAELDWDARLQPPTRVAGQVVTELGEPLVGCALQVMLDAPFQEAQSVLLDARGHFEVHGVPARRFRLRVGRPGAAWHWPLKVWRCDESDDVSALRLVVPAVCLPSASVRGRVCDDGGRPRADAVVTLTDRAGCALRAVCQPPDAAFRLGPVPAGRYRLEVAAPGLPPLVRELAMRVDDDRDLAPLVLAPAPADSLVEPLVGSFVEGRAVGPR
ncbi:MAG: sigma-70 family RNA polymerase sigma factor [Planctomycetota bacterium]